MYSNGVVVSCDGLFSGQLMVRLEEDGSAIEVLMMATNPNYDLVVDLFFDLITHTFRQCMNSSFVSYIAFSQSTDFGVVQEVILCPVCIGLAYGKKELSKKDLGTLKLLTTDIQVPYISYLLLLYISSNI